MLSIKNRIRLRLKETVLLKRLYNWFRIASIKMALYQQLLSYWVNRNNLDLKEQYTNTSIDSKYLETKVKGLQSFQLSLFDYLNKNKKDSIKVIDIGDSSGNHFLLLKYKYNIDSLSVNIDREAVRKIRSKGLKALWQTAEEFTKDFYFYSQEEDIKKTDVLIMYQTLEHIENPIQLLKRIKHNINPNRLIITVPYVKKSRTGFHHLRSEYHKLTQGRSEEDVHIFELSPEDWKLIFKHIGYKVVYERIYYQYPKDIPFLSYFLKLYWRLFDYEGFYGIILE